MVLNIPEGLSSASMARIVIEIIELKEKCCKWETSKKILRQARKILLSPDDASDFLGEGFRNESTQTDSENQKITKQQKLNRKDIPNHQDVFTTISTSGKSALIAKSVSELSYNVKKSKTKRCYNRKIKENRTVKHSKKFLQKKSSKSSVEKLQLNINLERKADFAKYQKKTFSDSPSKYVKSYAQLKILPSESVLQNNVQLSDISTARYYQLQRSFVHGSEELKRVDSLSDTAKSNNFNFVLKPAKLAPSLNSREENKVEITIISGNYGNGETTESNQQVKSEIGISAENINISEDYYREDIETISPNTEQLTRSSFHCKQREQSDFQYDVAGSVNRKRVRLKPVEQNDPDIITKDEDKTLSSHLLPQADEYNHIQQRLPLTENRTENFETDDKKRLNSNQKLEIDSADSVVTETTEDSSQHKKESNGFSSVDKETIALISPQANIKKNRINKKSNFMLDKYDLKKMKYFQKLPVPESLKNTYLSNFNTMENQTKCISHIKPCSILIKKLDTNEDPVFQFPTLEKKDMNCKMNTHYHYKSAYLNSTSMKIMPANYQETKTEVDGGPLMLLYKERNSWPVDRIEPKRAPFVYNEHDSVKKQNRYYHRNDKNISSESTSTTRQSKANWTCTKNKSYSNCKVKETVTKGMLHKYSPRYACRKSQKLRLLDNINESCKQINSAQRENNDDQMSESRTNSTKDSSSSRFTYENENSAQSINHSSDSNKDIEHLKLQRVKVGKTREQSRMSEVIPTSKCEMKEIFKTNDFKQNNRKAWITHNEGEIASPAAKPLLKKVVLPERDLSSSKEQTKDPFNTKENTLVTNYTLGAAGEKISDQSNPDREELCHSTENSEKKKDFSDSGIIIDISSVIALNSTSDHNTRVAVEEMGNDIFHLSQMQVEEQSADHEGEDIQSDGAEPTSSVLSQNNFSLNSTLIPENCITHTQLQKENYLSPESQMLSVEFGISSRSMVPVNPPQHPEKCRSLNTPLPLENLSPEVALLPKCPLENSLQHPSSPKSLSLPEVSPSVNIIRVENDSPVKSPPREECTSEEIKSNHEPIDPVKVYVSSQLEREVKNCKSGETKVDELDVNEGQQICTISETTEDKAPPQRSSEYIRKPADVICKSDPIIRKSCVFPSNRENNRNWDQNITVRDTNRYRVPPFQNVRAKNPLIERPPAIFTSYPNPAIFDSYPQTRQLTYGINYDPWYYPIAPPNARSYFRSGEQTYQHPNTSYWTKERYSYHYDPYSNFSSHYGISYQQDFQRRSHSHYPYSRAQPPISIGNQRTAKYLPMKYSQREENKSCNKSKGTELVRLKYSEGTTDPISSDSIARTAITWTGENCYKSETTRTSEKLSKTLIGKESEHLTEIGTPNENPSKMGTYGANKNFIKCTPTGASGNHSETVVTREKGNAIKIVSTGNLNERGITRTSEIFSTREIAQTSENLVKITGVSQNLLQNAINERRENLPKTKAEENENTTHLASNENLCEITMKSENFSETIIAQTNENLIEITTRASENFPKTQLVQTSENQIKIISRVSTNLSKIAISQTNKNLIEIDTIGSSENLPKCKNADTRKSATEIAGKENLYKMATTKISENLSNMAKTETNENVADITAPGPIKHLSKMAASEVNENLSKTAITENFVNSAPTIPTSENLSKIAKASEFVSNSTQTNQTTENLFKLAFPNQNSSNSAQTIQTRKNLSKIAIIRRNENFCNNAQTIQTSENLSTTGITSEKSSNAQIIQISENVSNSSHSIQTSEIVSNSVQTIQRSENLSEIAIRSENVSNSAQRIQTSKDTSNSLPSIQTSENLSTTGITSQNLPKTAITRSRKIFSNSSQTIRTSEIVSNSEQIFQRGENLAATVRTSEKFSNRAQTIQTSENLAKTAITQMTEILTETTTEESETFSKISPTQANDILTLRGTADKNELSKQNQILRSFPKSTSPLRSKCFFRPRRLSLRKRSSPPSSCLLISTRPFPNPPKLTQNESLLTDPWLSKKKGNLPNPSRNLPKCLFPMPPPLPTLTPEVVKYLSRIPPPKIMQNLPLPQVNNLPHLILPSAKHFQNQLMLQMKYHLPNLPTEMRYLSPDVPLTPEKYPSQNPIVVLPQDKYTLLNPPLPPEKDPSPNPPLPPDDDPSPDPPFSSEKDTPPNPALPLEIFSPNPALPLDIFSPNPPLPQEEYPSRNPPLPTEEYPSQNRSLSAKPSPSENPSLVLKKYISENSPQAAEENLADGSPQNPEITASDNPQLATVKYSAEGLQLDSETYTSSYRHLFPKKYLFQSSPREKRSTTFSLNNVTDYSQKLPFLEHVVVESENTSSDLVIPLRKITSACNKATSDSASKSSSQIRISKLKYSRKPHKCKHQMHKSGKSHSHHLQKSFSRHKISYTVQNTPLFTSAKCGLQRSSLTPDAQDASRTSALSYQKGENFLVRTGISNISLRLILEGNELEMLKENEDSAALGKLVTDLGSKQRHENTNNSSSSNVPLHNTIASISSSTSTSDNVEIPNSLSVDDNLLSAQQKSEDDDGTSPKQFDVSPHREVTRSRHYIHSPVYSTDLFNRSLKKRAYNFCSHNGK